MSTKNAVAGSRRASAERAAATPLVVLSIACILAGLAVHVQGARRIPDDLAYYSKWTRMELLTDLGVKENWLFGTTFLPRYAPEADRFGLLISKLFVDIAATPTGRGLILLVTSMGSPILVYWLVEAQKDGQSALVNSAVAIFVAMLGQGVMVGAATTAILVPVYAYVRWAEVSKSAKIVHPLPSPAPAKVAALMAMSTAALATVFAVAFVPTTDRHWMTFNLIFQFYPFVWLPALFFTRGKTSVSSQGSAAARQDPRLSAARAYRTLSLVLFGLHAGGVYLAWPGLKAAWRSKIHFGNAGEHVIFWDCIGCLICQYAIVLIDAAVDEAKITRGGATRTHNPRSILEDAIMGAPALVLLGPGWGMARYLQRRELLAEKARFGIKDE